MNVAFHVIGYNHCCTSDPNHKDHHKCTASPLRDWYSFLMFPNLCCSQEPGSMFLLCMKNSFALKSWCCLHWILIIIIIIIISTERRPLLDIGQPHGSPNRPILRHLQPLGSRDLNQVVYSSRSRPTNTASSGPIFY